MTEGDGELRYAMFIWVSKLKHVKQWALVCVVKQK